MIALKGFFEHLLAKVIEIQALQLLLGLDVFLGIGILDRCHGCGVRSDGSRICGRCRQRIDGGRLSGLHIV